MPSDDVLEHVPIAVMSIDQPYAAAILDGSKDWEYRTQPPARWPLLALLYATSPAQEIVGAVWIDDRRTDSVAEVVGATVDETLHDPADVLDYADGADELTALHVGWHRRFTSPVALGAVGQDRAPQNFQYLEAEQCSGPLQEELRRVVPREVRRSANRTVQGDLTEDTNA